MILRMTSPLQSVRHGVVNALIAPSPEWQWSMAVSFVTSSLDYCLIMKEVPAPVEYIQGS